MSAICHVSESFVEHIFVIAPNTFFRWFRWRDEQISNIRILFISVNLVFTGLYFTVTTHPYSSYTLICGNSSNLCTLLATVSAKLA